MARRTFADRGSVAYHPAGRGWLLVQPGGKGTERRERRRGGQVRKSHTAAMEILAAKANGPVATEPYEAGWAREALAVI